jgi:glycosyltransferase involved in cell wall biosynthesis
LLFVGRIAPHKGQLHLLRIAALLIFEFSRDVTLHMVGVLDPALNAYYDEIIAHASRLGIADNVEVHTHCSDSELIAHYRTAHLYICLSEHEGFNVPVIEAQAIGLPIVGAAVAATGETAGPTQLFTELPRSVGDDLFYAGLVEKVCKDSNLRKQITLRGEHNVRGRFVDETIENALVEAIYNSIASQ